MQLTCAFGSWAHAMTPSQTPQSPEQINYHSLQTIIVKNKKQVIYLNFERVMICMDQWFHYHIIWEVKLRIELGKRDITHFENASKLSNPCPIMTVRPSGKF